MIENFDNLSYFFFIRGDYLIMWCVIWHFLAIIWYDQGDRKRHKAKYRIDFKRSWWKLIWCSTLNFLDERHIISLMITLMMIYARDDQWSMRFRTKKTSFLFDSSGSASICWRHMRTVLTTSGLLNYWYILHIQLSNYNSSELFLKRRANSLQWTYFVLIFFINFDIGKSWSVVCCNYTWNKRKYWAAGDEKSSRASSGVLVSKEKTNKWNDFFSTSAGNRRIKLFVFRWIRIDRCAHGAIRRNLLQKVTVFSAAAVRTILLLKKQNIRDK